MYGLYRTRLEVDNVNRKRVSDKFIRRGHITYPGVGCGFR